MNEPVWMKCTELINEARSIALDEIERKAQNGAAYFNGTPIRGIECNGVVKKGEDGFYLVGSRSIATNVEVNDLATDDLVLLLENLEGSR